MNILQARRGLASRAACLALAGGAALPVACAPPAPAPPPACKTPAYTITDLGLLPACSEDIAPGLDGGGDVTAWASAGDGPARATLFRGGGPRLDLGALPDYPLTYAAGVCGGSLVVGIAKTPGDLRPSRAFLWSGGRMRDLGTLGGKYASARALNARGQVVGGAQTPAGDTHAALWPGGAGTPQATDLGTLGRGTFSIAHGINGRGDVVGASETAPDGKVHAFLWRAGRMRDLGTLPFGALTNARAVNDRGEVAGWGSLPDGETHAVLWRAGRWSDLGTLGDDPSAAWDVNDRGQVVGTSAVSAGRLHAFLWQNGAMRDLNRMIPAGSGWLLAVAYRINGRGQIVGRGFLRGQAHCVLLTPTRRGARNS